MGVYYTGVHVMFVFFFFNGTATTEIYTLSLHDALPICPGRRVIPVWAGTAARPAKRGRRADRKSTRLNSSHGEISYAVVCLKKKKNALTCRIACLTTESLAARRQLPHTW